MPRWRKLLLLWREESALALAADSITIYWGESKYSIEVSRLPGSQYFTCNVGNIPHVDVGYSSVTQWQSDDRLPAMEELHKLVREYVTPQEGVRNLALYNYLLRLPIAMTKKQGQQSGFSVVSQKEFCLTCEADRWGYSTCLLDHHREWKSWLRGSHWPA